MQVTSNNEWFEATVDSITIESPMVKTFTFATPFPIHNQAGQHFELRLTAENGYQAARLYSAVQAGSGEHSLKLTIMNVPNGEVSPYVTEQLAVGDNVEIRGPFGKFFTWTPEDEEPILLIAGGSGVVPMHAIFTAHQQSQSHSAMKLLYSSHTFDDILYKDTFLDNPDVTITLTKEQTETWAGKTGRLTGTMLNSVIANLPSAPTCYVCGMTRFVDAVTELLEASGIPSTSIKTERFG